MGKQSSNYGREADKYERREDSKITILISEKVKIIILLTIYLKYI